MDKELLEAIRGELSPIRQDIETIKGEFSPIRQDIETIRGELSPIKQDIEAIKSELSPIKQDINRLKILMEHDIPEQISLLAEGHSLILERLPDPNEIDDLDDRVGILETVAKKHSADIAEIKKAL